jgi:hypothetical protein
MGKGKRRKGKAQSKTSSVEARGALILGFDLSDGLSCQNLGFQVLTLATEAEAFDQFAVGFKIFVAQVLGQTAAASDHDLQAALTVLVFFVGRQVARKPVDRVGQKRDLHLCAAGVTLGGGVILHDLVLFCWC